jgi:hypothetical protein
VRWQGYAYRCFASIVVSCATPYLGQNPLYSAR